MSNPLTQSPVPTLYIVATPIGHMDDMTVRASRVLAQVARVLAEDTRHTQKLLQHYAIECPMVSLHEHNEVGRIRQVIGWLAEGESLALVSDAGTPLISDPGFPLVRAVTEAGYSVVPVPGACAVTAALSVSGLPTDRFQFVGFLPARPGPRANALAQILAYTGTSVMYESPRRIAHTLDWLAENAPERPAVLARELTKQFETVLRGTTSALAHQVSEDANQQRGELVLLLGGESEKAMAGDVDEMALMNVLAEHMPPKKAAGEAARLLGSSKNALYKHWLAAREGDENA